jgi:hypothetical protein
MKKFMIVAISILLLAACTKESMQENSFKAQELSAKNSSNQKVRVTRPISNSLESDSDPSLPPLSCTVPDGFPGVAIGGGVLFYGNMSHLGKVHGNGVNTSCSVISPTQISITSEDIGYAANGDQLWTEGSIVVTFPPAGSTIATITGGSKIVGGTGRFAGATGYFIYENMVVDLATGHESHTSYGEITY